MSQILVKESIPGAGAANAINAKLRQTGIHDVQLFYDDGIKPYGMWYVVQVQRRSSSLILPRSYAENGIRPYILWLCKTNDGHFRVPNDQDLSDIISVVTRGRKQFDEDPTGDKLADKLDEQSRQKDEAHRAKQKQMVKDIAPAMKRAIRKEML